MKAGLIINLFNTLHSHTKCCTLYHKSSLPTPLKHINNFSLFHINESSVKIIGWLVDFSPYRVVFQRQGVRREKRDE